MVRPSVESACSATNTLGVVWRMRKRAGAEERRSPAAGAGLLRIGGRLPSAHREGAAGSTTGEVVNVRTRTQPPAPPPPARSSSPPMADRLATYTHGHNISVVSQHRKRTAAEAAAFLLPHLK